MNRAEKMALARKLAAEGGSPVKGVPRTKPCVLIGSRLPDQPCGSPLLHCNRHNCAVSRFVPCKGAARLCRDCDDYRTFQPLTTRHLLYHIYPVRGNGAWQWNVDQLRARLSLFNGKRVIAVAVDPPSGRLPDPSGPHAPDGHRAIAGCDSLADVRERFAEDADSIEFIEVQNDPSLREVATYLPLFERLLSCISPNEATLYAQAKATTRPPGHIAWRWAEVLYEALLDHWPAVDKSLATHPVTGAFKKHGHGWHPTQSSSDWHYSGSWFWFRNHEWFAKPDWRKIDQFWSGIEPLPSQHFGREAGCVFHEGSVRSMNLYSGSYWRREVEPALAAWKEANK